MNIRWFYVLLLFLALLAGSCRENEFEQIYEQTVHATLKQGEMYEYHFPPTENQTVTFENEPQHSEISEILYMVDENENLQIVYRYIPYPNYSGDDFVRIKMTTESKEYTNLRQETFLNINFTIR